MGWQNGGIRQWAGNRVAQEPSAASTVPDLPSADGQPTARMLLSGEFLNIGRAADNDVVVADLSVSRRHAVLRKSPSGRYEIFDLDSHNGTYVNGVRVQQAELGEEDILGIGNAIFRLAGAELRTYVDTGDVSFEARDLTVVRGDKVYVDRVTFPVEGRSLVAVIGPSGAGKSTLLGALGGMRPADAGTVLYNNRDLYRNFAELRHRLGFVPQDDIVHTQLTPRAALGYAAEFRFPSDVRKDERDGRVNEVLEKLQLSQSADKRCKELSGGQRKRVNVALELLTKPSLLFLDEPTSGLDPGLDAQFMEQMRDLAHEGDGRTIIVVTHSVENLHTCDRLLVLVPGGKVAYYGPPQDALAYFGQSRWADVFREFADQPDRDWAGRFRRSAEHARYVVSPMIARPRPPLAQPPQQERPGRQTLPLPPGRGWARRLRALPRQNLDWFRQTSTLTRRYLRLIVAEPFYRTIIVLAPFLLAALVWLVSKGGVTSVTGNMLGGPQPPLIVLMFTACLAGVVNSIREVVKERPIYIRERAAGLSASAYLSSKVLVLCVIAAYQAAVMTAVGFPRSILPATGSFLKGHAFAEVMLATVLLEITLTCLGLLVSALMTNPDLAMPMILIITIVQFAFSGALFSPAGTPIYAQLSWFAPARWGMAALSSTDALNANANVAKGSKIDRLWNHTSGAWLFDVGMMLAWSVFYILVTWWLLNRRSPGRRKKWLPFPRRAQ
jgi:ABC transport system ATP-binding/permease protein